MLSATTSLHLQEGQQALTPEQEVEASQFAAAFIQEQLSVERVDEAAAEALLRQAYQVAGLAGPERIHWVDGPLQFRTVLDGLPHGQPAQAGDSALLRHTVEPRAWRRIVALVGPDLLSSVEERVAHHVAWSIWGLVGEPIAAHLPPSAQASLAAYHEASWLALAHFYATSLTSTELEALARFNASVSGYWPGPEEVIIVRRPILLARDAEGRLHSATGPCVAYQDGWRYYAWHGVQVSERIILAPDTLTREDFLGEPNLEIRRIIQERMGERFVAVFGGRVMDVGPRGTLYEVRLPDDDPERVARYLQVQDASTPRQYFLQVPPWVETAAEAVAWSFRLSVEDYHPTRET